MLIQAYCQKEREKQCKITANAANTNKPRNDDALSEEKMDTNETTEAAATNDTSGEAKPPDETTTTPNDIEMKDASVTDDANANKTETDEQNAMSVDEETTAPTTSSSNDENANKTDGTDNEKNDNETKVNAETNDENGNNASDVSKNDAKSSNSSDEPIQIEESTNDKDNLYSKDINIDPRTYCKLGHFHLLLEDYPKGNEQCDRIQKENVNQMFFSTFQLCQHTKNSSIWKRSIGETRTSCMVLAWFTITTTHIDGKSFSTKKVYAYSQ